MTQSQRHRSILDFLETHPELVVEDACRQFEASPATIRRDFNELVDQNLAEKTWGGIMKISQVVNYGMLPISYRQILHMEEKKIIAEKASSFIQDGDVIFIDGGTTTFQMASFIADKRIRIITNSIIIAYQIDREKRDKQGAEVFVTGGILYPESGLLVGPQTNLNIRQYNAKWAFLSAGALHIDGPSNSNQLVVESEQAMMEQNHQFVVVAIDSKFGHRNMSRLCAWEKIHDLITNKTENDAQYQKLVSNYISI